MIKRVILKIRGYFEGILFNRLFDVWQRLGFHVTKNHYYEPLPDTRALKDELWLNNSSLVGIDINEKGQLDLLNEFTRKFKREYDLLPQNRTKDPHQYFIDNGEFSAVDGEILYCMIRYFKPRRIFEVGSGNSTYLSAEAVLKNKGENYRCELTVCDPYPNDVLKSGFPGFDKLITREIQDIPLLEFDKLQENDILFIDSSHVLKVGSDVRYEYNEILPRLKRGVIVHIHDIFLPAEYPKEWILKYHRFWNEQYLLQAFLAFNGNYEVLWAASYMHLNYPDKLEAYFAPYKKEKSWPASFWMRKRI